jgi:hypothetical protein
LVCELTSHPFVPRPSQFANPALHAPSVQAPDGQVCVALARLQTAPQAPQFVSVPRLASQPFAASPSQLPKPLVHACRLQAPLKHVADAFANVQACPQVPQFATLPFRFVSHPLAAFRSQSPKPDVHATPQAPPEQLGVPFVALQIRPHPPQFVASFDV